MIYFTYNITPPANITNMFGNWLNGVKKNDKSRIRIGVLALWWSIWTSRNEIIFNRHKGKKKICRLLGELRIGFSNGPTLS
jgi:hypothetical protein